METVLSTLAADLRSEKPAIPADETREEERRRVWGACGGKCGETPCIEWNAENDRRKAHREEMTAYHADALRKAMGVTE
jgi:hypothetical protein